MLRNCYAQSEIRRERLPRDSSKMKNERYSVALSSERIADIYIYIYEYTYLNIYIICVRNHDKFRYFLLIIYFVSIIQHNNTRNITSTNIDL